MDDSERHAAIQDVKFPEGNLPFDEDCPEGCHEGRHYKHGDTSSAQYDICSCARKLMAEEDKKPRPLEEIKKDLREVRTEIAGGATPERHKELVDKLRVLRVEQVQAERTAEKGESDG